MGAGIGDGMFGNRDCAAAGRAKFAEFVCAIFGEPDVSVGSQRDAVRIGSGGGNGVLDESVAGGVKEANLVALNFGEPEVAAAQEQIIRCGIRRWSRPLCPGIGRWYQFTNSIVCRVGEPDIATAVNDEEDRIIDDVDRRMEILYQGIAGDTIFADHTWRGCAAD